MPFSVMLMPTTASPSRQQIADQAKLVVAASAGEVGLNGAMKSADGVSFRFDGHTVWLTRTSPDICKIVFDLTRRTNTYVATEGTDATPVKIAGSAGETPRDLPPATLAANPAALCQILDRRLWVWNRIEKAERASGTMDVDDNPLGPPADPGIEPRVAADPSGVGAQCDAAEQAMAVRSHWRIATKTITLNPKWGVVWRADVVQADNRQYLSRFMCWRHMGLRPGLRMSTQPLEMLDPKQSSRPLGTELDPRAR